MGTATRNQGLSAKALSESGRALATAECLAALGYADHASCLSDEGGEGRLSGLVAGLEDAADGGEIRIHAGVVDDLLALACSLLAQTEVGCEEEYLLLKTCRCLEDARRLL